ncbi:MAG TPA: hypothetical protein VF185_00730 [Patescibacteria group bacterium]
MTDQQVEVKNLKDMSAEQINLSEQSRRAKTLEELGLAEKRQNLDAAIQHNVGLYSKLIREGNEVVGKKLYEAHDLTINPDVITVHQSDLDRVTEFTKAVQKQVGKTEISETDKEIKALDAVKKLDQVDENLGQISDFLKHKRKNNTEAAIQTRQLKAQIEDAKERFLQSIPQEGPAVKHIVNKKVAAAVAVATAGAVGAGSVAYAEQQRKPQPQTFEFKIGEIATLLSIAKTLPAPENFKGGDPWPGINAAKNVDKIFDLSKRVSPNSIQESNAPYAFPVLAGGKEFAPGEVENLISLPRIKLTPDQQDRLLKSYEVKADDFAAISKDINIPANPLVQKDGKLFINIEGSMLLEADSPLGQMVGSLIPFMKFAKEQGAKLNLEYIATKLPSGEIYVYPLVRVWGLNDGNKVSLTDYAEKNKNIYLGNNGLFGAKDNQLKYVDPIKFKGIPETVTKVIKVTEALKKIVKGVVGKNGTTFDAVEGDWTFAQLTRDGRPLVLFADNGSIPLANPDSDVLSDIAPTEVPQEAPFSPKINPDAGSSSQPENINVKVNGSGTNISSIEIEGVKATVTPLGKKVVEQVNGKFVKPQYGAHLRFEVKDINLKMYGVGVIFVKGGEKVQKPDGTNWIGVSTIVPSSQGGYSKVRFLFPDYSDVKRPEGYGDPTYSTDGKSDQAISWSNLLSMLKPGDQIMIGVGEPVLSKELYAKVLELKLNNGVGFEELSQKLQLLSSIDDSDILLSLASQKFNDWIDIRGGVGITVNK